MLQKALSIITARLEWYLRPRAKEALGGPFNNQQFRQSIFRELVTKLPFKAVVETGTFRGSTTEFMARESHLPVYTVEARPRYYEFARMRLGAFPNVRQYLGDSRSFLRSLAADPQVPKENLFFYLDAHWYKDLPLREEVELISRHFPGSVAMIDDFEVPGDRGYTFDDYGPGRRLCLEYLGDLGQYRMLAFFPSAPSHRETGFHQGCVVLADESLAARVQALETLRAHEPAASGPRLAADAAPAATG